MIYKCDNCKKDLDPKDMYEKRWAKQSDNVAWRIYYCKPCVDQGDTFYRKVEKIS